MAIAIGSGIPTITTDFPHQATLLETTLDRRGWATFWEMGTGKSRPTARTVTTLYKRDEIDGCIVVAPNGVHRNWISDELPRHCDVAWIGLDWHSKRAKTKEQQRHEDQLLAEHGRLPVLSLTYEGLLTRAGADLVRRFTARFKRIAFIVDESARVKNPTAQRTKAVKKIANIAELVRLLNGTPIANSPLDVFSQMQIIDERFWLRHGIGSYTAFKARFAVTKEITIAAQADPTQGKLEAPAPKSKQQSFEVVNTTAEDLAAFESGDFDIESPDALPLPDLPAETEIEETPRSVGRTVKVIVGYRDLDALKSMISSASSRLTKEDAGLNLPPKLYNRIPFELTPEQRRAYDTLRTQYMLELDSGALVTAAIAMVRILRLQQIACGYLPNPDDPDGEPVMLVGDDDPRMEHFLEILEDTPGKAIVWGRFTLDIDRIMRKLGKKAVRYDGEVTSPKERAHAIDSFRGTDAVRYFVAKPSAIGMGVTLVEANTTIYYSNSFSLPDRQQSEDRNHRIGQHHPVLYFDLVAERTVDERILKSLQSKADVAAQVTGDRFREWLA